MKAKFLAAFAVLVATSFIYAGAPVALADDSHAQDEEARTVSHFVALGDSLAARDGATASDQVGYAGIVRHDFQHTTTGRDAVSNLAVLGETSSSFISGG